jgi:ankyrin repeat protein
LINKGANPNIYDKRGQSPLHLAVEENGNEIIDLLLAHDKVNVDHADEDGETALHFAASESNVNAVQKLIEKGANPNIFDKNKMSPLHIAAMQRDVNPIIDLLLAHPKVKVDDVDGKGHTALHLAASESNVNAVQKLIEKGANPNIFDKWGQSLLHVAAWERDGIAVIDLLLAHPKVEVIKFIDDVDEDGQTALHFAAYKSNVKVVKNLINKGANPNIYDKRGQSPLHLAAWQRDGIPIIDLLLEAQKVKGIGDVDDANEKGRTALHYAAAHSNEITAEHLINKGADVNRRDNKGYTPLHLAATGPHAKDMNIIDVLLRNINEEDMSRYRNDKKLRFYAFESMPGLAVEIGDRFSKKDIKRLSIEEFAEQWVQEKEKILKDGQINISGRNRNGETLLFAAIRNNSVTWVRWFLKNGADPTIRNEDGHTPFHVAVDNAKDFEILNLLLENGKVDINETTHRGRTALHIAVLNSNTATAAFLLSKEANPNVTDEDGLTPLHWAVWYAKDMDIVELLVNHKDIDVNCLNNAGSSALDYAMTNKHGLGERIVKRLKEKDPVEREYKLPKGNRQEIFKKMRALSNRTPNEIVNCVNDDTITIGDKISRISESEECLVLAIQTSNLETLRLLLKNGADTKTWGEMGANALHFASCFAETTDVIDVILETWKHGNIKFNINGGDNDGDTPLHWAIIGPNFEKNFPHLIQKGADPTIANKEGDTPLHLAAKNAKEIETIKLILENKQVDIDILGDKGRTALHYAIRNNNVEIVRYLLQRKADHTIRDKDGITPLHLAALHLTDTDIFDLMLANEIKIDIDEQCNHGMTALHMAIISSNVPAVRFLLSNGANPKLTNKFGNIPLHLAVVFAKDMEIVELLLNHPDVDAHYISKLCAQYLVTLNKNGLAEEIANLLMENAKKAEGSNPETKTFATFFERRMENIRYGYLLEDGQHAGAITEVENGVNALHVAAANEKTTNVIDAILETGKFDIDRGDNIGRTPLHHAIMGTNREINARHRLEKGADPTIRNNKGNTPFHLAAALLTDTHVLGLMLGNEIKIDIDEKNNDGATALHLAIGKSNVTAVRLLLSNGANPNIADKDGDTPLHVAAAYAKDMDIVELLLNKKYVDVNCLDKWGKNALWYAMFNMHGLGEAIANLLREKMASVMKFRELDLD